MREYTYNKRGTRQLIQSNYKRFDKQTNLISTGNVISNTQLSSFIRPYSRTECNGNINPEGHLMRLDMKPFEQFRIPQRISEILKNVNRRESVILYMFHTTSKDKHIEPFGWAVTTQNHILLDSCVSLGYRQQYDKLRSALDEAISYITD